jgi:4'-phosphopantetheinyl transferase
VSLICELARIEPLVRDLPAPQDWLSDTEFRRLSSFTHLQRRRNFLAGRRLAGVALTRWPKLVRPVLSVDEQGRSHIEGQTGLFMSISHSGDWVACAIADAPIGVDIENLGCARDFGALARMVHSPSQCKAIAAATDEADRAKRFYQWWTLKEAWFKRQGLGLDLARMPQLDYQACEKGPAVCSVLPRSGLMLALDGPACERWPLPTELAGETPAWRAFQYG